MTFVLAYRPIPQGHELAGFADASVRDGALHVMLGPLDDDAVVGLVEDVLGYPPERVSGRSSPARPEARST